MIVVSDTSPINYLVLIGAVDVLGDLYGGVIIPPAVASELSDEGTPDAVRRWFASHPDWISIRSPSHELSEPGLHAGELEAISLAEEIGASLLLVDERRGRNVALAHGLRPLGVLGILDAAATKQLIDLRLAVERLTTTNFRASQKLIDELLRRHVRQPDKP